MTEQSPARPSRPFESLDWYREATRSGRSGRNARERFLDWARGIGFLSLHVSVYALGIVTMFIVNLLHAPDDIWVDRAVPTWTLIVVIHAGVVGLLWAIGQLNRDDDEPIRIVSDATWRNAETWPNGGPAAPSPEAPVVPAQPPATSQTARPAADHDSGGVTARRSPPPAPASAASVKPASSAGPVTKWSGWESDVPQRIDPNDPDRASWQEAAAAAWRDRTSSSSSSKGDAPEGP